MNVLSFEHGSFHLQIDAMLIPLLAFIIFVFGWCFIGFSLHNELLLFVNDAYFRNKNILLLIAHPDDESMFFSPLLSYLSHKTFTDHTYILSLSNGGSDVRAAELKSAAFNVFSIRKRNIEVVNDETHLKDNIKLYWNDEVVIKYVNEYVEQHDIDIIFTFDKYGISGHPNHISIYNALQKAINEQRLHGMNDEHNAKAIDVYSLRSRSVWRKYSAWLEPMLWLIAFLPLEWSPSKSDILVLSAPNNGWSAMTHHASQFVWYRRLFILFSRYVWLNEFDKIVTHEQCQHNTRDTKKRQ